MNFLLFLISFRDLDSKRNNNDFTCPDASLIYDTSYFNANNFIYEFKNFSFRESPQKFAGKGHFSVVRKYHLDDGRTVAVKEFRRFKRSDLIKELSILRALKNVDHVVKVVGLTGSQENPIVLYSYHHSPESVYQNITLLQFQWWLKTILETVSEIHSRGIFHRDLKLGNIITDFDRKELTIIDFGLAEFNTKSDQKNPHVGCYRIKAPELVIENRNFDCKIDIWSIGIMCLDIMINLKANWIVKSDENLIQKLITYFGSDNWNDFAIKYNESKLINYESIGDIFELALPGNYDLVTPESLDLVFKFLKFDPKERICANEALKHPFFSPLNYK